MTVRRTPARLPTAPRSALAASLALFGLLQLGSLVACSNTKTAQRFDSTRVAGIPPAQMPEVTAARNRLDDANNSVTLSKRDKREAEDRVNLSSADVDVAQAEFDRAKQTAEQQRKKGEPVATAPSGEPRAVDEARELVDASKAKKTYLESLRDLAGKRVDHSERAVRLAQAELDEAQFNALERNDPQQAAALKETREKYAARVAEEKAQVSKIDADLAEKRTEAQRKYDAWLQLERRLKSPGRQGTVPPPPRG